ncbi:cysteine-rich protein 1-like [Vespula squamosa]|uniref:Cysteine-rich protein 1 n=1 Tax=Vespula squamosa TaxID=30214 RepID=A0ABD2C756_VESSQ
MEEKKKKKKEEEEEEEKEEEEEEEEGDDVPRLCNQQPPIVWRPTTLWGLQRAAAAAAVAAFAAANATIPERKTFLGNDWHSSCLRCEKCNKTLTPGSHAEHEGKPYCNHPCYSALFGPGGKYQLKKINEKKIIPIMWHIAYVFAWALDEAVLRVTFTTNKSGYDWIEVMGMGEEVREQEEEEEEEEDNNNDDGDNGGWDG